MKFFLLVFLLLTSCTTIIDEKNIEEENQNVDNIIFINDKNNVNLVNEVKETSLNQNEVLINKAKDAINLDEDVSQNNTDLLNDEKLFNKFLKLTNIEILDYDCNIFLTNDYLLKCYDYRNYIYKSKNNKKNKLISNSKELILKN